MKAEKIGIADAGGGFRGSYGAGVLDWCMDHGVQFDLGIGVSAGSANLVSYAAGQHGRNYRFYTEYGLRSRYAGVRNFLTKRSYVDLDYIYGTLSNSDGEDPLDYPAVAANPMELYAVATEAETGNPKYFDKSYLAQDRYDIFKASSAIPLVCRPWSVDGVPYYDGAFGDPIPVQKCFDLGCDRVVLVVTLPEDYIRTPDRDRRLAVGIRRKYPLMAKRMEQRADRYNRGVAYARKLAEEGKVLIVAPDDTCGVSTLTRDNELVCMLYAKGYHDGEKIAAFLRGTD